MKDREFLIWLHERLKNVHGESELFDYMHRLRNIIQNIPKEQCSVSAIQSNNIIQSNDIDELKDILEKKDENT